MSFKICLATQQYGDIKSGVGTYAVQLINGLYDRGYDISVICPCEGIDPKRDINFIKVPSTRTDPTWLSTSLHFSKKISAEKFDLIHFLDARESIFCQQKSTPIVGTMHDTYFAAANHDPFYYYKFYKDWIKRFAYYNVGKFIEKRALNKLHSIITNTEFVKNSLYRYYNINIDRLKTIHIGIDPNYFWQNTKYTIKESEDKFNILFIGGNFQRKGLPTLIKSGAKVVKKYPKTKFIIVGNDPNVQAMKALCKHHEVTSYFNFVGKISEHEKINLYHNADIFVMPSLIEGFGIVFLEAMASRVPVIGGNVGGTSELISHGFNGFLVEPNNSNKLTEYIIALLDDHNLREKFINNGLKSLANFTIDKMIRDTIIFYEDILNNQ